MHPVLLKIGSLPINSYGLMLAVSFLLGLRLAAARSAAAGVDRNAVYDLGIRIMMAAIIGSRLFYVVTHTQEFEGSCRPGSWRTPSSPPSRSGSSSRGSGAS